MKLKSVARWAIPVALVVAVIAVALLMAGSRAVLAQFGLVVAAQAGRERLARWQYREPSVHRWQVGMLALAGGFGTAFALAAIMDRTDRIVGQERTVPLVLVALIVMRAVLEIETRLAPVPVPRSCEMEVPGATEDRP